jgi:SAM-dependent methyltransferase
MTVTGERPDGAASMYEAALRGEPCLVHGLDVRPRRMPTWRWSGPADRSDAEVLAYCDGPTLDIGCGPGRMTEHLTSIGVGVLGIDIAPEAVAQTRRRGATAVRRDVFDSVPGEGGWMCALLADGNIGIGGDPVALLRRVAELLAPGGWVVADVQPPGCGLQTRTLELEHGGRRSSPFAWSVLGVDSVTAVAAAAGLHLDGLHERDGRWFVVLVKDARRR